MKKILIIVTVLFILISNSYSYLDTYKITSSDKITINKLSSKINKLLDSNDLAFRSKLEQKINSLQYKYKNSKKLYAIFQEIKLNTYLISYKKESENHYNEYTIDINKVKKAWISWHNKARKELWRTLYSYDERLNNTAYEWSKFQDWKWFMSHKRTSDWPFYDYDQIEKWFTDRWVKCKVKSRVTTSESIWKFWYYCNDSNCTDELIKSLKVLFDIYINEKWMWYPADAHYRAIVHKELSKMWLWLSIRRDFTDEYKNYKSYNYYVTTHYCTEFKK